MGREKERGIDKEMGERKRWGERKRGREKERGVRGYRQREREGLETDSESTVIHIHV